MCEKIMWRAKKENRKYINVKESTYILHNFRVPYPTGETHLNKLGNKKLSNVQAPFPRSDTHTCAHSHMHTHTYTHIPRRQTQ